MPETAAVAPVNFALDFDGQGSHVVIPDLLLPPDKPFTMEAYAKPRQNTGARQVVGKFRSVTWVGQDALPSGALRWVARHRHIHSATAADTVVPQKLVHLACVWDGKECRFYVNGVGHASATMSGKNSSEGERGVTVGARMDFNGKPAFFFDGLIDEVHISSIARYDKDFSPAPRFEPDKDTLALYHFDEGQGETLIDSSGNGHHGKIVGAKWVKSP